MGRAWTRVEVRVLLHLYSSPPQAVSELARVVQLRPTRLFRLIFDLDSFELTPQQPSTNRQPPTLTCPYLPLH